MSDKIWNVGLQQYERVCDKCGEKIIEDEVRWFKVKGKIICECCHLTK